MLFPGLPMPLPGGGLDWSGAPPYLVAGVTAGLGWFAAQFTGTARLQREVNAALHALMDELQTRHAQDIVRISDLSGEVSGLKQLVDSLKSHMRRHGLTVPGEEHNER